MKKFTRVLKKPSSRDFADKAKNFNENFFIIIIIYKSNKAQCKTEKGKIVFTERKSRLKN